MRTSYLRSKFSINELVTLLVGGAVLWALIFVLSVKSTVIYNAYVLNSYILCTLPLWLIVFFGKNLTFLSPSFFFSIAIAAYEIPKVPLLFDFEAALSNALLTTQVNFYNGYEGVLIYQVYTLICFGFFVFSEFLITAVAGVAGKDLQLEGDRPTGADSLFISESKFLLYCCVVMYFISLANFIFVANGDVFFFLKARILDSASIKERADSYLFIIMLVFQLFIFPYIFRRISFFAVFAWSSVAILLFLYTGSRGFIIWGAISIMFCVLYRSERKIRLASVVLMLPLFIIFFGIAGYYRSVDAESFSLAAVDYNVIVERITGYQGQLRDELVFSNIGHFSDYAGFSFFSPLLFLVPRSWLGELKPVMLDGDLAVSFWGLHDVGLPVHMSTELFLNFGTLGFVWSGFVVALALVLRNILVARKQPEIFIAAMIFSQTLLSSKLIYVTQLLFIFVILHCAYRLLVFKRA